MLLLDPDGSPPPAVEVRRTFETFARRLLARANLAISTRPDERRLVECDGKTARYEPWPATHLQPWRRPTKFEFRDPSGAWNGVSRPLEVFERRPVVRVPQREYDGTLGGGYAGAQGRIGVRVKTGEEITMLLDVAVDPEFEPFAFSPAEGLGHIAFESYVETCLAEIEEGLAAEDLPSEGIREMFADHYGEFIGKGSGLIFVSFEPTSVAVKPRETSRVTATLHGEREGGMLLVLGARHLGTGEVFFSEPLPLIWQPGEDAARASHEEAARKQEILRRKGAKLSPLKPRGEASSLEGRASARRVVVVQ